MRVEGDEFHRYIELRDQFTREVNRILTQLQSPIRLQVSSFFKDRRDGATRVGGMQDGGFGIYLYLLNGAATDLCHSYESITLFFSPSKQYLNQAHLTEIVEDTPEAIRCFL